ncbi:S8 family serine peptidase, partial [bacterium]|nr:S8 family serine peptidase [bacterium]
GAQDHQSGHGTHVAGSVLGNGALSGADPVSNSFPTNCFAGIAPKASLVFQAAGSNGFPNSIFILPNMYTVAYRAYTNGARIHQNSWGSSINGRYNDTARQVDYFSYTHPDMLFCFSSGNSGVDWSPTNGVIDLGSVGAPGSAKNCLTIGASESLRASEGIFYNTPGSSNSWPVPPILGSNRCDDKDGMAAFSSRGPCTDSRLKPDVVAPGVVIASARTHAIPMSTEILWGNTGLLAGETNYVWSAGTSMSCPLGSGAAALVREYLRVVHGIGNAPAALVKAMLINGATDMTPGQYPPAYLEVPPVPNNVEGWGRINLEGGLYDAGVRRMDHWYGTAAGPGKAATNVAIYGSALPAKFNLVWTDYPGSPWTFDTNTFSQLYGGGLVNDLDLLVIDPAGATNYPLAMNPLATLFYYTNVNSFAYYYNTASTLSEAEQFTAPQLPFKLSRLQHFVYDISGVGGQFGVFVWQGDDTGGPPGSVLLAFTNTLSAGGHFWYWTTPADITITTSNFYVGTMMLTTNVVFPRDYLSTSPRTWERLGAGAWSAVSKGDMWIHAYGAASTGDHMNTVEGVIITNPAAGSYRIEVSGANVSRPPVSWAVAYSGEIVPEPLGAAAAWLAMAWLFRRRTTR